MWKDQQNLPEVRLKLLTLRLFKFKVTNRVCVSFKMTAELREQLQSKEKEHELAVHTLKDQVIHTHKHKHTQTHTE